MNSCIIDRIRKPLDRILRKGIEMKTIFKGFDDGHTVVYNGQEALVLDTIGNKVHIGLMCNSTLLWVWKRELMHAGAQPERNLLFFYYLLVTTSKRGYGGQNT